ncbi:MAG TPA: hypothetical protein PLQ88_13375, partial [Blastocatellia bacterium]|nr:hypothetical protein [Blastocatellia bacterium]
IVNVFKSPATPRQLTHSPLRGQASFIFQITVRCLFSIFNLKFKIGQWPISQTEFFRQSITNKKCQLEYGK